MPRAQSEGALARASTTACLQTSERNTRWCEPGCTYKIIKNCIFFHISVNTNKSFFLYFAGYLVEGSGECTASMMREDPRAPATSSKSTNAATMRDS